MSVQRNTDDNRLVVNLAVLIAGMFIISSLPGLSRAPGSGPPILSWAFLASNLILLMPPLTLVAAVAIWWVAERQPLSTSVAVQYGPPSGLSPAEASALLQDSVKARAIVSTVVDLAVRGYLSIEPAENGGNEYVFRNLKKPNWANDLAAHERDLMAHIFEYGEQPCLATLWHGLPEYVDQIKDHILNSLTAKKMYRLSPILGGVGLLFGGFVVLLVLWLLAMALGIKLTEYNILNPVCFALAMGIIFLFSKKITLKSALGQERLRQVKGFQEFMRAVDGDRMKRISPDIFEKYLPYAVALGVETEWTRAFKGMLTRPLSWYTGALAGFLSTLDE